MLTLIEFAQGLKGVLPDLVEKELRDEYDKYCERYREDAERQERESMQRERERESMQRERERESMQRERERERERKHELALLDRKSAIREAKRPRIESPPISESLFNAFVSCRKPEGLMDTVKEIPRTPEDLHLIFPDVQLFDGAFPLPPFNFTKVKFENVRVYRAKETLKSRMNVPAAAVATSTPTASTSEVPVTLQEIVTDFCKKCNSNWLSETYLCDPMQPRKAPDGFLLAAASGPRQYGNLAFAIELKLDANFLLGMTQCFIHIFRMLAAEPRRQRAACMLITEVRAVVFAGSRAPNSKLVDMKECTLEMSRLTMNIRALLKSDPSQLGVPNLTVMEINGKVRDKLSVVHEGRDRTVFLDSAEMCVVKTGTHLSIHREYLILEKIKREGAFNAVRAHIPEHVGFDGIHGSRILVMKPVGRHLCMVNDGDNIIDILKRLSEVENVLEAAHKQNIFHRDVSYSNILVTENGAALLIDWGSAAIMNTVAPPMSNASVISGGTGVSDETSDRLAFTATSLFMADDVLIAAENKKIGGEHENFVYCGRYDMESLYFVMLHILQNGYLPWYKTTLNRWTPSDVHFSREMRDEDYVLVSLSSTRKLLINSNNFVDSTVVSDANRVIFDRVMKTSRELYLNGTFSIRALLSRLEE